MIAPVASKNPELPSNLKYFVPLPHEGAVPVQVAKPEAIGVGEYDVLP